MKKWKKNNGNICLLLQSKNLTFAYDKVKISNTKSGIVLILQN
jgi:hypothetical protein